jgi:hypothetical protein
VLPVGGDAVTLKKVEKVETTDETTTTTTVVETTVEETKEPTEAVTKKYAAPAKPVETVETVTTETVTIASTTGADAENPFKADEVAPAKKYAPPPPKPVEEVQVKSVDAMPQQAPPAQVYQQGPPPPQMYQQGPPPQMYQQGPPPAQMYQQGPPQMYQQGAPRPQGQPTQLPSGMILAPGVQLAQQSQWAATQQRPPGQPVQYGTTLVNKNTREPLTRPPNQPPCQGPPPPGKLWCLMCVGHGFRGNPPNPWYVRQCFFMVS